MKVYVIMGNDYPDCVFATEQAAEAYVAGKIEEGRAARRELRPRIHWRYYEFEVRQ